MKLHFEDNLDYQKTAIEAAADLFCGQDINRTEFTVSKIVDPTGQLKLAGMEESTLGIGNRLQLLDDELLENLKTIQLRNGLSPSASIASGDFTVEMKRLSKARRTGMKASMTHGLISIIFSPFSRMLIVNLKIVSIN